jgi:uracil phosphoribosyltransferase
LPGKAESSCKSPRRPEQTGFFNRTISYSIASWDESRCEDKKLRRPSARPSVHPVAAKQFQQKCVAGLDPELRENTNMEHSCDSGKVEMLQGPPPQQEKKMQGVTVVDHPLVQHKLTIMRNKETSTAGFRRLLREISLLLCYEVTRNLELTTTRIETPLESMDAPVLEGKKLVFASVLRAGNGLLEGLLDLVPAARVAHIGLYRDHETLEAVEYFFKAPSDLGDRLVIVVDPMLATANSAIAAINKLKERGATNLRYLCLLAAPEGIERFTRAHPDVPVFTASIDRMLNEKGYIVPGLGDAGDRMYGTK